MILDLDTLYMHLLMLISSCIGICNSLSILFLFCLFTTEQRNCTKLSAESDSRRQNRYSFRSSVISALTSNESSNHKIHSESENISHTLFSVFACIDCAKQIDRKTRNILCRLIFIFFYILIAFDKNLPFRRTRCPRILR